MFLDRPTQHSTTNHRTTQPRNAQPNIRPNTQHPTPQHPNLKRGGTTAGGEGGRTTAEGGRRLTSDREGRKRRMPNRRGWSVNRRQKGRRGRRSEPLSHGEVEGIHSNAPFRSEKGNGRATQRRRNHHPKEAEGSSTTKRGRGGTSSFFWGGVFFLFRGGRWVGEEGGGVLFSCLPLGGADYPPLPCWVVSFPLFLRNMRNIYKKS